MICPHCQIGISYEYYSHYIWEAVDSTQNEKGHEMSYGHCPECEELIIKMDTGKYNYSGDGKESITNVEREEFLYPKYSSRNVEPEVPDKYKADYLEACQILSISPKASAALSRRILQNILREEYKIKHPSLAHEIEDFIHQKDIPSYLGEAVDAIRNIGNFAAHPLKDTSTGEIVDVEAGEAEWLLDVNESLFDFTFVQPKRLEERKKKLNDKLKAIGKPPMKSK